MAKNRKDVTAGMLDMIGARGRNRTGTGISSRGILSPLRLPIPPPGLEKTF